MKRNSRLKRLVFGAILLLAPWSNGCGKTRPLIAADTDVPAIGLDEFKSWAEQFVARPHSDVLLPDPDQFFAGHFATDLARKLAAEYTGSARDVGGLPSAVMGAKEKGKTVVQVQKTSAAIDIEANGLQNAALQRSNGKLVEQQILNEATLNLERWLVPRAGVVPRWHQRACARHG